MFDHSKIKSELHELMVELKVIPENLSPQDVSSRFFYLFIELDYSKRPMAFNENLFGEDYNADMMQGFHRVFSELKARRQNPIRKKVLSVELINEFFLNATQRALKDEQRHYRTHKTSDGFFPHHTSLKFMKQIAADDSKSRLELTGDVIGNYRSKIVSLADLPNTMLLKRNFMDIISVTKIEEKIEKLIEIYEEKMRQINAQNDAKKDDQKIELIGTFIGDLSRLHPYRDGNGRLFYVLTLNYLLLEEGLTPTMVYQPWHLSYTTKEERVEAIKEGQLAFKHFFLGGNNLDESARRLPLTKELQEIILPKFENVEEICRSVFDLFTFYIELQTLKNYDASSVEQIKLAKENLNKAINFLANPDLKKAALFDFPVEKYFLTENAIMRSSLSLYGLNDVDQYDRMQLVQKFGDRKLLFDGNKFTFSPSVQSEAGQSKKTVAYFAAVKQAQSQFPKESIFQIGDIFKFIEHSCFPLMDIYPSVSPQKAFREAEQPLGCSK